MHSIMLCRWSYTRDYELAHVMPSQQKITAYEIPVVGKVLLRVWRRDFKSCLDYKIVDWCNIRPLLGRRACVGMKIVAYLNNHELNKPSTGTSEVYVFSSGNSPSTQEQLIHKYPKVFGEGVERLESEYHI